MITKQTNFDLELKILKLTILTLKILELTIATMFKSKNLFQFEQTVFAYFSYI